MFIGIIDVIFGCPFICMFLSPFKELFHVQAFYIKGPSVLNMLVDGFTVL